MKLDTTNETALRSGFGAPTRGGALAGVRPQVGSVRLDGGAFAAMGVRPWSPLLT